MITLTIAWFFVSLLMAGMLFVSALWFYYDRRDRNLYEAERLRRTFHCIRCGALYTAPLGRIEVNCPHCDFKNTSLRF